MKRNSLFILALLAASTASADQVSVPLPNPVYENSPVVESAASLPDFIDISVSSWAPVQLHPASNLPNVSTFSSQYPGISVSYLRAIRKTRSGDFYWRSGLEFRGESRAAPGFSDEDLYLTTLRLGIEWKPPRYHSKYFIPYLGFSFLPTWASASPTESSYDNGISDLSFPAEFNLGTEILLSQTRPSLVRLTIAAQLVLGRVLGSGIFSSGVIGGARFPL